MTIYVVQGSSGEYSDRTEWLVRAYRTEDAAKPEVLRLDEKARIYAAFVDEWDPDYDIRYSDKGLATLKAKAGIDDPEFRYGDTRYWYDAIEVMEDK